MAVAFAVGVMLGLGGSGLGTIASGDGSALTALNASNLSTGTVPAARLPFGIPISPSKPDTVQRFYSLTTTAGSSNITVGGGAFTSADVGKLIMCTGIGPTEGRLTTYITAVTDATHITTATPATQAMTAVSQRCVYGSDQSTNIQAAFTNGTNNGIGSYVQGGLYLIGSPLTCLPPPANNSQNAPGPMCQLDAGATIMAMAPMITVVTYGGVAGDYSEFLRNATFGGGTLDGNFLADYGADVPFYNVATRTSQVTKNTLLSGVRWGNLSAPAASGGSLDSQVSHLRDVTYVTVTGITNGVNPIITTQWDHGYATGRVVTLVDVSGMTQANSKFFQITVTGARSFTLNNTASTSWGTFIGTASVALTMPSMRVPSFVTGITNANPAVVTTSQPHGFANGQPVWLADMTGINLGGVYTVANVTSTTFELSGIDTTLLGTYSAAGTVIPYLDPSTVEKAIYYENGIDADVVNAQISGVRYGIYANPATAGYDSKIIKPHFYNYNENGELFCAISLGGDNTIVAAQIDVPMRYAFQFVGPRNHVIGSRMTYLGVLVQYNNYASFVRLESGGEATVSGGGAKGNASAAVLGELSQNGSRLGYTPGYSRGDGFKTEYVSLVQPDSSMQGTFNVINYSGAASLRVTGAGASTIYVYDRTSEQGGMYVSSITGGANLNTTDNTGKHVSTPMSLIGSDIRMGNLPTNCSRKPAGTLWNNSGALNVCP